MRKLAIVAFSFGVAVFGANYGLPEAALLPLGLLLSLFCPLLWSLGKKKAGRQVLVGALCCAGLGAGCLWMVFYTAVFFQPAQNMDDQTVRLEATVIEWPQQEEYGWSVPVRAETESFVSVTTILYTDEQGSALRPGDRISTVAHCTLGDRTFSGEPITYYTAKGVFLRAQAYGELTVDRPGHVPMRYWPALLAKAIKESIDQAFPEDVSPLVRALVTGNRERLSDGFTTSLQRTGLSHTVAVSGMHLAFLSGLLTLLLGHGKRSTAVVTILWVLLFCGVAGNTPSVLRAAIMILLLQIAPLLNRERDDATALGFALMLLLLWNPYAAAHVGLQLSFGSVAGILLLSERIQDWCLERLKLNRYIKNRPLRLLSQIPKFFISTLSATLGASLLTVPLVAIHFQMFSLISPLANLLTLWAVAVLFVGGLMTGLVGMASSAAAGVLAVPFTGFARYLNWVIEGLGNLPLASISLESVYYRAWVGFFCVLMGVTLVGRGKKRIVLPLCAAVLTLITSILFTAWTFQGGVMTAVVLDVGQGQSVLLRNNDYLTLVDCGGDGPENAGDVAADYIQSMGRTSLDLLVVSHYHNDHANGIEQLLSRVSVSAIALPDVEEEDPLREKILMMAREKGIDVWHIQEETHFTFGEAQSMVIYPPLSAGGQSNELGLTVLATSGSNDVLLTGDMGSATESVLLDYAALPDIELLVVGHHGSKYSTSEGFLSTLCPETAVISVGLKNRYGHPAEETLARLDGQGIAVYRTDLQGTVEIHYQQ